MDVIEIIQKHSLTVRCLPYEVVSHWRYREGETIKDGRTLVELPKWGVGKFVKEVRVVEKGGWWYVKETKNTGSNVTFNRKYDKFFAPTLEQALQMYLDSLETNED